MQLIPNSRVTIPQEDFQRLTGFIFAGPGLYTNIIETILVIPKNPAIPPTSDSIWFYNQPNFTLYEINIYNVPYHETIFSTLSRVPNRT